ncbi:MAG: 50S ribosomal protein L32e [Candidatus Thermoplasmatota archaeon]
MEETEIVKKPRKKKASVDEETKSLMEKRKNKPRFIRQQLWQVKRLRDVWRRPRGVDSKQRKHYHYRPPLPRIGYSSPKKVKGLHPSGFKERLVYSLKDMEGIDAEKEAIRIAHTVGKKKRQEIIAKADELGVRVLNRVLR